MSWPPNLQRLSSRSDNPPTRCGCGRKVSLDMMLDVRALPPAVRGESEAICDSCRELWFMTERISRAEFYAALGAPVELVAKATRLDLADAQRRPKP